MKKDEMILLIEEGEGFALEFRSEFSPKIDQDIVAFANSKGGKILLGVNDDGKIVGESLTGELKAKIFDLGRNCDPKIEVKVSKVENVVVVTIEEGQDKPYSCSGNYYKRFDGVTQKLNRNETKTIFNVNNKSYFDESRNLDAKTDDISLAKVREFYKTAGIKYEVTEENLPNILKSLNLMKDNSINNAGVLFFAEKMDPFFLHSQTMLLAFKDYEGVTIFDRKEVRGDLISQFNEADFFLKKHMSLQGIIQGTKRRNVYEVPQEAWREAIANAIIHRDYRMSGTSMQVRVFPNRIEIISPGRLPEGITPENVGDISSRRNEIIADMFARLDVIEKAGTGILRIRKAMREEGLKPPVFETKADFFKVILYRPHGTQPSEARDAKSQTKKTKKDTAKKTKIKTTQESAADKILDLIKERPKITKKEIAEALGGITPDGVKYHLNKLVAGGKIKRIGLTKNAHWEVCS